MTFYVTNRGLKYKYSDGYKLRTCMRCKVVIRTSRGKGYDHVCIPGVDRFVRADSGYNPDASLYEQYETLSLMFATLAQEARETEAKWQAAGADWAQPDYEEDDDEEEK